MAISVREISTGCKTALNIFSFPNKVFSVTVCGDNAPQVIFNLKQGKVYMTMFSIPRVFENNIEVHTVKGIYKVSNNKQLEDLLNNAF